MIGINKSLSDRGNGVYCYYVEAKELETNKEYTVPAKIVVDSWDDDVDGKRVIRFNYYIEQLFFDDGTSIIFDDYEDASFTSYTGCLDENGKDLIKRMLNYDPELRISCKEALNHPYFQNNNGNNEEGAI